MNKKYYQSRYKTVVVEKNFVFNQANLYVSIEPGMENSIVTNKPARSWHISRYDELVEKASMIAPVYNNYAQVIEHFKYQS